MKAFHPAAGTAGVGGLDTSGVAPPLDRVGADSAFPLCTGVVEDPLLFRVEHLLEQDTHERDEDRGLEEV